MLDTLLCLLTGNNPPEIKINFNQLFSLAHHHKLDAVACYNAINLQNWTERLSQVSTEKCTKRLHEAKIRQMIVYEALLDALDVLHKYPHVLFKGIAVAEYYPESWLRYPGDIDILVRPGDYRSIVQDLHKSG